MSKKKIYFIAPYPHNAAPSQRFRFEQYFSFLEQEGYEVKLFPFLDEKTWKTLYSDGKTIQKISGVVRSFFKRFFLLFSLRKADFIFIHREASHLGPPIFEWLIAKVLRRKYIYDFDDAIWLPNYSESNAKFHRLKAYWKVNYCMKWAYQVSAGNQFLADYARQFNSNIVIIPTTIDTENYHTGNAEYYPEKIVLGWTGTHTTMRYLDALVPVFKELTTQFEYTILVISNEKPAFDLPNLEFIKWNKESEIEDLKSFSIGIMPLVKDQWSEGKCGFKGLQYMSLGIPTIMSPVGVNTEIIDHGTNGIIASTEEEWKQALETLIVNAEMRKQFGRNGKQTIIDRYSVLSQNKHYLNLFFINK
jgi:glycosyltransferase involved in cell wall biosynthesis